MLQIGSQAPDLTLPDQDGRLFKLSDHIGKRVIVLFFYPKDHTGGCTREVCSFRDNYTAFSHCDCVLAGISGDSEEMHRSFASKYALPFHLLSDKGNTVRKLYKAQWSLFGIIPGRVTYVIDLNGKIAFAYSALMDAEKHVSMAIEAVKQLAQGK